MKKLLFIAALLAAAACSKKGAPRINSFTADKTDITDGDTVTLSFDVTGATTLTINPTPGPVTSSPITVTPHASTVYTLRAANDAGAVSQDISINVNPLPTGAQISFFSALPSQVKANDPVKLTWSVARATSIAIYDGTTTRDVTGVLQPLIVNPSATTTYTMTATSLAGTLPASVTAKAVARVVAAAHISSFTASPTSPINQGQQITLSWDGTATSWQLSDGTTTTNYGPLKTATVEPAQTTTYTLTAVGMGGNDTRPLAINVTPMPGTTLVYTASSAAATLNLLADACSTPCTSIIFRLKPATTVSLRGVALNIPLDAAKVSLDPATLGSFVTDTPPAHKAVIGAPTGPLKNTLVLGAALKGSGTAVAADVSPSEVAHFTLTLVPAGGQGTVFNGTGVFSRIQSSSGAPSSIAVGTLVVQ